MLLDKNMICDKRLRKVRCTSSQHWQVNASFTRAFSIWTSSSSLTLSSGFRWALLFAWEEIL